MPLAMRDKVFITAALTGSGSTQDRSDRVPRSPEQIATAAIDAAKAGASVVHCHVRDPETGAPDRAVHLYREVVERIRASDTDVVINLTAGMGGDIVFGPTDAPLPLSEQGTDMVSAMPEEALKRVVAGIPAGRLGKPEEIASMVVWLASEHGSFATGATFAVNGGQFMA